MFVLSLLLTPATYLELQFRGYLEAHGFDTSLMGLPGEASTVSSVDI